MLGSLGSQLGALQLGSVPSQAASEAITGIGAIEIGCPALAGVGTVAEIARSVRPTVLLRPAPIRGRARLSVRSPALRGVGLVVDGVGAVSAECPALIGRAGIALAGRGEVNAPGSRLEAFGEARVPRPRLRSGSPREVVVMPSVRRQTRVAQKVAPPIGDVDHAWRDLQREQDDCEVLMVLGND